MGNIKFKHYWKNLPWGQFRDKLYLIQTQIFNLVKYKNFKKALLKQKVLLFSLEIYSLAIKQITQLRLDRKIPGIDNCVIRSAYERIELLCVIKEKIKHWHYRIMKKIYLIDFLKGKILYQIPTISDRIIQYIWKLILEPVFNALFFENQIFLSSIHNFLFIKYSVVLKFLSDFKFLRANFIHLKWNIFSCFKITFNRKYLLKTIFFPDSCKTSIITCFSSRILVNPHFLNENLQSYLHMFHYFVISFGFSALKYIFLKELNSKFCLFSDSVNVGFSYCNEMVYLFYNKRIEIHGLFLINKLVFHNVLLNNQVLILNKNPFLGFDFLDWNVKLFKKYICRVVPNFVSWRRYKNNFKRILKSNKYSIYQRIKFLELLTRTRIAENWFCLSIIFRKEFYILKTWFNKYVRNYTDLSKVERSYFLKLIFKI